MVNQIQWKYWKFFWPLALLGLAFSSGRLAQNYILMQMEDGVSKLALYSLAFSIYMPLQATLVFLPQTCTILVRSQQAHRVGMVFVALVIACPLLIIALLAYGPLGDWALPLLFQVREENLVTIQRYLRWFMPFLFFQALTFSIGGLFIQWHRTGIFTLVQLTELVLLILSLFIGIGISRDPVIIIGAAGLIGRGVSALVALFIYLKIRRPFPEEDTADPGRVGLRQFGRLFLPMAVTSIMFALNRPILFFFVTRTSGGEGGEAESIISAITLGMGFIFLFQGVANQYRHVGATFTKSDPDGSRKFITELTVVILALLGTAIFSPLLNFFLTVLQNADGKVLEYARIAVFVMAPTPLIIAFRNYYHGVAMVHRRTGIMSLASLNRNLSIVGVCIFLMMLNLMNIYTAALVAVIGFLAETVTVVKSEYRKGPTRTPEFADADPSP